MSYPTVVFWMNSEKIWIFIFFYVCSSHWSFCNLSYIKVLFLFLFLNIHDKFIFVKSHSLHLFISLISSGSFCVYAYEFFKSLVHAYSFNFTSLILGWWKLYGWNCFDLLIEGIFNGNSFIGNTEFICGCNFDTTAQMQTRKIFCN